MRVGHQNLSHHLWLLPRSRQKSNQKSGGGPNGVVDVAKGQIEVATTRRVYFHCNCRLCSC